MESDYSRSLTAAELAAVTAGDPDEVIVTLDQDEADRDAFFAGIGMPMPKAQEPPKPEPRATPGRSNPARKPPGETL